MISNAVSPIHVADGLDQAALPVASSRSRRSIYGADTISERHRHRYEVNVHYKERLEQGGLVFSGMSPDGELPASTAS